MTSGQRAYEAFVRELWTVEPSLAHGRVDSPAGRAVPCQAKAIPWNRLPEPVRGIWESVAKAVRE